jgi:hypothetical protein
VLAHPNWALGFLDEVWWNRLAQPAHYRWGDEDDVTRLQELEQRLAWYGVLLRRRPHHADHLFLRCVDGRPVSAVTIDVLTACCEELARHAVPVLVLIWDTISWHKSLAIRTWMRSHNQTGKQTGKGVRLLPSKRPWLKPIEATWVHGTRNVSEADRILSAEELEARVCASSGCARPPPPRSAPKGCLSMHQGGYLSLVPMSSHKQLR